MLEGVFGTLVAKILAGVLGVAGIAGGWVRPACFPAFPESAGAPRRLK